MPGEQYDFGAVRSFTAEAIGEPGQRRFRLAVQSEDASASLWLEKEQLSALSTAIEQQLVRTRSGRREAGRLPEGAIAPLPLNPSVDLQVGQLALGYDDARQMFVIQVYEVGASEEGRATFGCLVNREQARLLVREVARLMTSGRPICPLCGAPMQGEHICPRSNGHADLALH